MRRRPASTRSAWRVERRRRRREPRELLARIRAPRVGEQLIDERLRVGRQVPAGIPLRGRGAADGAAGPQERRDAEPAPAENRRRRHDGDAVAAARRRAQGGRVVGLQQQARPGPRGLAGGVEAKARGEVAPRQQDRLVVRLAHLEGAPAGQPMPGRHHREHPHGEERPRAQIVAGRHRAQRQVQLAARDARAQPHAAVLDQPYVDARPRPAEAGEERADQALERLRGGAQAQRARAPAGQRAGALAQRVRGAQDLARALQEIFALGGEVQAPADAVEERQAQLALEIPEVARQRGLGGGWRGGGAGNVAALLRGRWPGARVTGVDASATMLERARASDPGVDWRQADVAAWAPPAPVDVLFSNATLHWIDDHAALFPRLVTLVAGDGALAVQMPRNFGEPSHTSIYEVAREGRWRDRLETLIRPEPTKPPEYYWDLLAPDRKSTRLNSSHGYISYAVFCLKKKKHTHIP